MENLQKQMQKLTYQSMREGMQARGDFIYNNLRRIIFHLQQQYMAILKQEMWEKIQ